MNEQVNPVPDGVDARAAGHTENLALVFSKLHTSAQTSEEKSTLESIQELMEMAARESRGSEGTDMGKAVKSSNDYSPILDSVFREADTDPRTFGKTFRTRLEEADSIDDLFRGMGADLGVSDSSLIEKRLEESFTSGDWDDSLSLGIRGQLEIALNLSLETINYLSEVSNKEAADARQ